MEGMEDMRDYNVTGIIRKRKDVWGEINWAEAYIFIYSDYDKDELMDFVDKYSKDSRLSLNYFDAERIYGTLNRDKRVREFMENEIF